MTQRLGRLREEYERANYAREVRRNFLEDRGLDGTFRMSRERAVALAEFLGPALSRRNVGEAGRRGDFRIQRY